MNIIEVKKISKVFRNRDQESWALREINLSIKEGIIFSLLGPNGAGKSTLLNIMTNILTPTSGQVQIFGKEVSTNVDILNQVGFTSTDSYCHWAFKVRDVLNFYGLLYNVPKKIRKERIEELMDKFELRSIEKEPVGHLSTGERLRLIFAKSLIHNPKILLLDEPTSGLDPDMARKVRQEIKRINKQGVTIILTSHNMREVEELSNEIGFIYQGKIIDVGEIKSIKSKHFSNYEVCFLVKEVFKKEELVKEGFRIKGRSLYKTIPFGKDIGEELNFLQEQGFKVQKVESNEPDLEDYFVKIMSK